MRRHPGFNSGSNVAFRGIGPVPPVVLLLEQFPEVASTTLNGKMPQIGNVWSANVLPQQGDDTSCFKINASHCCVAVAEARHSSAMSDVGESDCTVTMVVSPTFPSNIACFIVFRVVNHGTYMFSGFSCADGATVSVTIEEVIDGVFNTLLGQSLAVATGDYTFTLTTNSDSFTLSLNGTQMLSGSHADTGIGSTSVGFMQYFDSVLLFPAAPIVMIKAEK